MSVAVASPQPLPAPLGPILLVEDEEYFARCLARVLTHAGLEVLHAPTVAAGIALLERRPAVVVLDWNLPDGLGERVLDAIAERAPGTPVAVLTGNVSGDLWLELTPRCQMVLPKPIDVRRLPDLLRGLVRGGRAAQAVRSFGERFGLSPREEHLVAAAAKGRSDKDVAHELGCARGTIATYWQRIFGKTGQRSQRDVVAAVFRHATEG